MMSAALLLSLSVNVFASTDLSTSKLGWYQYKGIDTGDLPGYYKCTTASSNGTTLMAANYHMGKAGYYCARAIYPSSSLPTDSDFVQLTFLMQLSPQNVIDSEYRKDFFTNLFYVDNSLNSGTNPIDADAVFSLKPLKILSEVTGQQAKLSLMFKIDQFLEYSDLVGQNYHFYGFFQINQNFLISQLQETSGIGSVILTNVKWTDTSDLIPVDDQTLLYLNQIQGTIENGFTSVIDAQNLTNDKLDSIDSAINGNYVDPSDMENIDNTIGDHSAAEAEVNGALDDILNMDIEDADGNSINVSFDGNFFQNLENSFNFNVSGPAVANSASIFRNTLTGFIGLFGPFIFFPLVLGILGALLGRASGA